jgi:capsular exopolysaccharide synthesis family protein
MHILQAESRAIDESKRHEIRQIAQNLKDEVQVSHSREGALAASIDTIRRQLANYQAAEIGLAALQRPAKADQALLETYINRSKEIGSLLKAQASDAQIISTAQGPDEAAYPRRHLIYGVVAFGSLLVGSLTVFGLERLDTSFRSFEQIEDLIGLPGLGLLPTITEPSPADYILDNPNSAFGTAVRKLRTSMLLTRPATPPQTVLVTSSVPGEGKTSVAVSLARINARSGKLTLLIDCDLRIPSVHKVVGISNQHGLSDVLQMRRDPNRVIILDKQSGAHVMPAGGGVFDPEAALASGEMIELLLQASLAYDLVILDSPPVLRVADARVLSSLVDKTVFLAHWGSTPRADVLLGIKELLEAGADIVGVALSQVDAKKHARYGYRDSEHYVDERHAM